MPNLLSPGVYIDEQSSGSKPIESAGTAVAAFVGLAEDGPFNRPVLVTNWTQFTDTFGGFVPGSYLAKSVYQYFLNGGGVAYVVRIGDDFSADDEAPRANAELRATDGEHAPLTATALLPGPPGDAVVVEVLDASDPEEGRFALRVKTPDNEEFYDNVTIGRGANNVATRVKAESQLISLQEIRGVAEAPARGAIQLTGGCVPAHVELTPDHYVGDTAARTGLLGLEAVEEITMLVVPDVMAAYEQGTIDSDGVKAVQLAMIAHCEQMGNRVAILDAPPNLTAQEVLTWRKEVTNYDSKFTAMYYPWVQTLDPVSGKPACMPPGGAIAGIWARNDETRGVHKAPANEVVRGAMALELNLTKGEHDLLNPCGVNCIRSFPGQGIRVWGARTLSSDPEWRYLNVRRLFNFVESSLLAGTNWVVFEPNDMKLWDSVTRTITMFLRRVWKDGALFGRSQAEAFYVRCDEENNPLEKRDVGILTVEIGIAPVKPAEFVVFRLSQFNGGAGIEE